MDEYYFDKVVLLLHGEGADGSTTVVDSSSYGRNLSNSGTSPQIKTADFKYGGASVYFAGNGYKYIPFNDPRRNDFGLGAQDFTIEAWVKITATSTSDYGIFARRYGNNNYGGYGFFVTTDFRLRFNYAYSIGGAYFNYVNVTSVVNVVALNTWTHVAVTRKGSTLRLFVDGVAVKTDTIAVSIDPVEANQEIGIGKGNSGYSTEFFKGYIDELRVTVGLARYSDNFTPPTAAFPNSTTGFIADVLGEKAVGVPQSLTSHAVGQVLGEGIRGNPQAQSSHSVGQIQGQAAVGVPQVLTSHAVAQAVGVGGLGAPVVYMRTEILAYVYGTPMLEKPQAVATQQFVLIEGQSALGTPSVFARHGYEFFQALENLSVGVHSPYSIVTGFFSIEGFTFDELIKTIANTKLRDYVALKSPVSPSLELTALVQEQLSSIDTVTPIVPMAALIESVGFFDTALFALDRVLQLIEQIRFSTKLTGTGELLLSAQTQARLADAIALRQTSSLAELITLTGAAAAEIYYGALAVEQVLMDTGSSMLGEYSRSLKEFVTLLTANGFVSGVQLAEAVGLLETATPDYKRELSASDQLAISAVQSVLVELTNTLAETWRGADQLQMARVLGLSEQLLVEAAIITGANGKLSEQLGLVERAAATLELVAYLKDTLTASEITAFISALGLAETLTLADVAVHDAVAQLLAREPLALVALVGAVTERGAWLPELVELNTLAGFRAEFGVVDALSLTDQALLDYLRDWLLKESIGVSDKTTPALELAISLAERVRLLERAAPVLWSKLETGFSLTELARYSLQYVLKMQEQLRLADVSPVMMELLTGLAEIAVFVDYAGTVSFLTAADQFTLADLLKQQLVLGLADQLSLADLDTVAGFFALDLSDNLVWADKTQSLGELFARAASGLMFFGRMPLQEGDYTAWVFNTDTLGMTQYTNYSFNSMMLSRDRLFGLTETGLYLLEGSTDNGVDIDTLVATGDLDFGVKIRKAVPRAYLYITKPGQLVLRTISYHYGQAQEHFYEITLRAEDVMGVHRLRLRREIRAEAWAFEIKNVDGGEFELQGAEILPVLLTWRN